MLSQEVHDLRFWGIEGEDYMVGMMVCIILPKNKG